MQTNEADNVHAQAAGLSSNFHDSVCHIVRVTIIFYIQTGTIFNYEAFTLYIAICILLIHLIFSQKRLCNIIIQYICLWTWFTSKKVI